MDEFEHELTKPFDYHYKGDQRTAQWIQLRPPTTKNMTHCAVLKQAFFQSMPKPDASQMEALKDITEDQRQKAFDDGMSGSEIMTILSASKDVKLDKVFVTARELFTSGIAFVDSEEKLTKPLCDLMGLEDFENMVGKYIANFIVASSLK